MPVRVDVVQRKLGTIRDAVERLRSQRGVTTERLAQDVLLRWALERGLHVAAEAPGRVSGWRFEPRAVIC